MPNSISRRDFLNGTALLIAGGLTPLAQLRAASGRYYPPALTGLRGSHPGSFEVAHQVGREGRSFAISGLSVEENFDLVVVGGGISGLAGSLGLTEGVSFRPPRRLAWTGWSPANPVGLLPAPDGRTTRIVGLSRRSSLSSRSRTTPKRGSPRSSISRKIISPESPRRRRSPISGRSATATTCARTPDWATRR